MTRPSTSVPRSAGRMKSRGGSFSEEQLRMPRAKEAARKGVSSKPGAGGKPSGHPSTSLRMAQAKGEGHHYDATSIQILGDLEAGRKRPAMYIGSPRGTGLPPPSW